MAEIDNPDLQEAADRLHEAVVDAVGAAPAWLIAEADWEWEDEDWVRDVVVDAEHYASWRRTGEHRFIPALTPKSDLDVGRELAENLALSGFNFFRSAHRLGWPIPSRFTLLLDGALDNYRAARTRDRNRGASPGRVFRNDP